MPAMMLLFFARSFLTRNPSSSSSSSKSSTGCGFLHVSSDMCRACSQRSFVTIMTIQADLCSRQQCPPRVARRSRAPILGENEKVFFLLFRARSLYASAAAAAPPPNVSTPGSRKWIPRAGFCITHLQFAASELLEPTCHTIEQITGTILLQAKAGAGADPIRSDPRGGGGSIMVNCGCQCEQFCSSRNKPISIHNNNNHLHHHHLVGFPMDTTGVIGGHSLTHHTPEPGSIGRRREHLHKI